MTFDEWQEQISRMRTGQVTPPSESAPYSAEVEGYGGSGLPPLPNPDESMRGKIRWPTRVSGAGLADLVEKRREDAAIESLTGQYKYLDDEDTEFGRAWDPKATPPTPAPEEVDTAPEEPVDPMAKYLEMLGGVGGSAAASENPYQDEINELRGGAKATKGQLLIQAGLGFLGAPDFVTGAKTALDNANKANEGGKAEYLKTLISMSDEWRSDDQFNREEAIERAKVMADLYAVDNRTATGSSVAQDMQKYRYEAAVDTWEKSMEQQGLSSDINVPKNRAALVQHLASAGFDILGNPLNMDLSDTD